MVDLRAGQAEQGQVIDKLHKVTLAAEWPSACTRQVPCLEFSLPPSSLPPPYRNIETHCTDSTGPGENKNRPAASAISHRRSRRQKVRSSFFFEEGSLATWGCESGGDVAWGKVASLHSKFVHDLKRLDCTCRETLPENVSTSEPLRRWAPYIWTHQYTHLSPSTCFVLDDGTGKAVGYCIGCPDIYAFQARYDDYVREVLEPAGELPRADTYKMERKLPWVVDGEFKEDALAQTAWSGHWLLVDGNEDLLADGYRATMHVDLLDGWQGKGWGRKLVDLFVESVRKTDSEFGESKGIWIGVGASNAKVVPFYEKLGFRVKKREVRSSNITMVRDY
ncbi:Acyl-CoA N-acyltransferase [Pochonia chlamydosporia 170]|uniref:Acyl-CoA N-acyltransferase n=1 Tax=Pochonia chlamydosporia 170 TaxID=1380566 RepID=A0A179G732_METCM|nr:Acyl-CoA N-acyltransferase [Pochonia chlamydosporia 170]OAQ73604.1 Acyl-CoA N-acyltransferase [Pochonia chlamydosporia 170]